MLKRLLILVVMLVGLLTTSCTARELNDSTMSTGLITTIPFKLHENWIIVELSIDGSDPLDFIFDTGAGGTLISESTAERLGIGGEKTVSQQGAAGDAPIVTSENHTIQMGELTFQDVKLAMAELDQIHQQSGMITDGAIGWKILSQYAVRLDYDAMKIEIYDTKRFDYRLNAQDYDVEVKGTSAFIDATVAFVGGDVFTGKVLLDTGSNGSIYFNTPFSRENDLLAKIGSNYERETPVGLSMDSVTSYTTMLPSLSLGQYKFNDIPAKIAFVEAGALSWPKIMGILGNEILMRFNMFIDIQKNRIYLEPNHLYHEAFDINCSGLELVLDDTFQKVIIDYVYPASPAEESGLKVGDEIIQIDGVSASDLNLPQIRRLLSQEGKEVEIIVYRAGVQQSYLLILRPLISL